MSLLDIGPLVRAVQSGTKAITKRLDRIIALLEKGQP